MWRFLVGRAATLGWCCALRELSGARDCWRRWASRAARALRCACGVCFAHEATRAAAGRVARAKEAQAEIVCAVPSDRLDQRWFIGARALRCCVDERAADSCRAGVRNAHAHPTAGRRRAGRGNGARQPVGDECRAWRGRAAASRADVAELTRRAVIVARAEWKAPRAIGDRGGVRVPEARADEARSAGAWARRATSARALRHCSGAVADREARCASSAALRLFVRLTVVVRARGGADPASHCGVARERSAHRVVLARSASGHDLGARVGSGVGTAHPRVDWRAAI
jgi:hypothetical protein